jgi:hypothetical protein
VHALDGNGWIEQRNPRLGSGVYQEDCPDCLGNGWRPMTEDEIDAAAEQRAEDDMSDPPMSMDEMHRAAWAQKQELRR